MGKFIGAIYFFAFVCSFGFADPPKGFEDKSILDRVMKGEIVKTSIIDKKFESKVVLRAFSNKTSTDAYIDLAVNHAKYGELFEEIQEAKTIAVNDNKTVYDWWIDRIVGSGIFSFHVYPEGRQTVTRATEANGEAKIENLMTNYKDQVEIGLQQTRLIPYENGILIEDTIHVRVKQGTTGADTIKKEIEKQFNRFLEGFRSELGGDKI